MLTTAVVLLGINVFLQLSTTLNLTGIHAKLNVFTTLVSGANQK